MKRGLYAWAGASATASAAACAKRLDEPMTNESNVYFGFSPPEGVRAGGVTEDEPVSAATAASLGSRWVLTASRTGRSSPVSSRTAAWTSPKKWASIQFRVKSFGTVRTTASSETSPPSTWSNQVRKVVSLSASFSRSATSFQRSSAVSSRWRSTRRFPLSCSTKRAASIAASNRPHNGCFCGYFGGLVSVDLQVKGVHPHRYPQVGKPGRSCASKPALAVPSRVSSQLWKPKPKRPRLYSLASCGTPFPLISLSDFEAHLSAQRASAKAPTRLPRADGNARRPGDPQAPSRTRSQAPIGLTAPARVERRHRLSRSRDFEAVYRHGRSFASRYVVLYWFPREDAGGDPRLGLAVPKSLGSAVTRNRLKRQLREAWRARLDDVPPGRDYVLLARAGLPDAADSRGLDWLGERIDEVLRRAT